MPQLYDASNEFAGKRVVLVSVPGAFTPVSALVEISFIIDLWQGCQARHIPPYIENIDKLASKGVDLVVVIASNDAFVMAACKQDTTRLL